MSAVGVSRWISGLAKGLGAWRPFVGAALSVLAGGTVWLIAQVDALGETVDRYARMGREDRAELEKYITEFKAGDPTKSDFLNRTIYRVRMRVLAPEAGADMLCWFAAVADKRVDDAGSVDVTTADAILQVLDTNRELFNLRARGFWFWERPLVSAQAFCGPYFPRLRPTLTSNTDAADPGLPVPQPKIEPKSQPDPSGDQGGSPGYGVPPGRLFLQIADEDQRTKARTAGIALATALPQVVYQGVEFMPRYAGGNEIRYYKTGDQTLATSAAGLLRCDGAPPVVLLVKGYQDSALIRARTLELWIRPGSGGCTVSPPPRSASASPR